MVEQLLLAESLAGPLLSVGSLAEPLILVELHFLVRNYTVFALVVERMDGYSSKLFSLKLPPLVSTPIFHCLVNY